MTTALEVLAKVKRGYTLRGKTLHAHVIHNAIQVIQRHEREQKAKKEVPPQASGEGPTELRLDGNSPTESGAPDPSSHR